MPDYCAECGKLEFRFFTRYYDKAIYECTSCGHLVSVELDGRNVQLNAQTNEKHAMSGLRLAVA